MKIKLKFNLEIISTILGFFFIVFLFWNRLLRIRLPQTFDGNYYFYQKLIFILFFILSLSLICSYIYKLLNIKPNGILLAKILENHCVSKIVSVLNFFINAPFETYIWLFNKINFLHHIESFGRFIWERDPYRDPKNIVLVLYGIRIIVSLSFLFDILIYNKFYFFYKIAPFLLIPLMMKAFIFIIQHISFENKAYIENNYIIVKNNPDGESFDLKWNPNFTFEDLRTDKNLYNHYSIWICYLANCMFVDKIAEMESKIKWYVMIVCYSIYAMGWGYIVFFMF